MIAFTITIAAALIASQAAAPGSDAGGMPAKDAITELAQLPITEAAAPRCGVVFAFVEGRQEAGDPESKKWPDLKEAGGREFFVQTIAKLMDDRGLDRDQIQVLVDNEIKFLLADPAERVDARMPGCLLMLQASGA